MLVNNPNLLFFAGSRCHFSGTLEGDHPVVRRRVTIVGVFALVHKWMRHGLWCRLHGRLSEFDGYVPPRGGQQLSYGLGQSLADLTNAGFLSIPRGLIPSGILCVTGGTTVWPLGS